MSSAASKEAFARYNEIATLLNQKGDRDGMKLLHTLINKCADYFRVVADQGKLKKRGDSASSRMQLGRDLAEVDELRTIVHNALISDVVIFNRYLFTKSIVKDQIPIGGIYTFDPETLRVRDRRAIGDWALCLVEALFEYHILDDDD